MKRVNFLVYNRRIGMLGEHRGNHKERALVSHGKLEIYVNFPLCTGITSFPRNEELNTLL